MKQADNIMKDIPQLECDPANGNVYWQKTLVARQNGKNNMWQKTQAWDDAIGIDWTVMKAVMEKED